MMAIGGLFLLCLAVVTAHPADPVLRKYDSGYRYQYIRGPDGTPHLVDLWMKASDAKEAARYDPDRTNIYHLFTRENPEVSEPLLLGNEGLLHITSYNPNRRTVILLHSWMDLATSESNAVLVPAFLAAEDLNVIVVDWSSGAGTVNYMAAVINTVTSGESVARFINWLNSVNDINGIRYHIVGHGLGAHHAGITGRNVDSKIAYITGLDPLLLGWLFNDNRFQEDDAQYTEVIHTNAGLLGYLETLGQVDFYPNGGINMPGCSSQECDHARSYFYMAESLNIIGFTGRRCASFVTAMTGTCVMPGRLQMGGLRPKNGATGVYHLETNEAPPFSRG